MADTVYPLFARVDELDPAQVKYDTQSTPSKTSLYESESPLGAHSSTGSSRLSGSYEPSQVSSIMDDLSSGFSTLRVGETATSTSATSQRPQLSQLILPSNMPQSIGRADPPRGAYANLHSYPQPLVAMPSPVLHEHPSYAYGPIAAPVDQRHAYSAAQSFPSPIHYSSPPPMHATPYQHPSMPRRTSFGVYYNYEYSCGAGASLQSPISPYGYHPAASPPLMYMPPTPTHSYPIHVTSTPAPAPLRQGRPVVSSPLRPLRPATSSTANDASRRHTTTLFASASSFGHQASVLANRPSRRDHRDGHHHGHTGILADVRNNKLKRYEIKDIAGHCVEFSADQYGSRFLQQKFDHATPEERRLVFEEIVPEHALRLMKDVFGNYVIQKLFEHGSLLDKEILCNIMQGNVLQLTLDMYGCRVVQKAVDCCTQLQQSAIVAELSSHILNCVKDSNGNHVIQKLLERVVSERPTFIHAFTQNVYHLATHLYGCRVLQRCFEYCATEQLSGLLEELHQKALSLMQDQYGNYVIQFVLEYGAYSDRSRLVDTVLGRFLLLARHKFASNVCEKAIAAADPSRQQRIIEEILTPGTNGVIPVSIMMKDQYANYVLQKALNVVEGDLLKSLVAVVLPQLVSMRRHAGTHSNKQLTSIERLLKEKGIGIESYHSLQPVAPLHIEDSISSGSPTP